MLSLSLVDRATGTETPVRGVVVGGTLTRDDGTKVKESCDVVIQGGFDPGSALVRVRSGSAVLGTFVPSVTGFSVGATERTPVSMVGRLCELSDDMFDSPVTFSAGTPTVEAAASIVRGVGLDVAVLDQSLHLLGADRTYGLADDDGSKLDAVNDLLGLAGFDSARTDVDGTVLFRRSRDVAERPIAATFGDGTVVPTLSGEADASGVANVVHAVFTGGESAVVGVAVDEDPTSRWSTVSRGRRIVKVYQYDSAATQQAADEKAAELLKGQQSVVRRVEATATLGPTIWDAVQLDRGPYQGVYAVRSMSVDLASPALKTKYTLRRFERG